MKIGQYKLTPIETGTFWLDGGAMFGTIPKVMWEKYHQADSSNRIKLAMRSLLIQGNGKNILVDCGLGDKGGEKFASMFNVDHKTQNLDLSLQKAGLTREQITDVILTHLHFDHAGGATFQNSKGGWEPSFPSATYYLQKDNLEAAKIPNPRERASYLPEIYQVLVEQNKFKFLDGNTKIFDGIEVIVTKGHTESQQLVKVSDGKTTLLYGGDILPTPAHLPLPWIAGYDLHPLTMLEEKKKLLDPAVKEGWVIFYEHDPVIAASKVKLSSSGKFESGDTVSL